MSTKREQLEAEREAARAELSATVDELGARLDPRTQASNMADSAKQAATDAKGLLSGEGMPDQGARARNVKVLLGAAAAVALLTVRAIVKKVTD